MKAIKSVKQCFESSNVIIIAIHQGNRSNVRIDAKTRFYVADKDNFFSEWISLKYANQLAITNYGKKVNEFSTYKY